MVLHVVVFVVVEDERNACQEQVEEHSDVDVAVAESDNFGSDWHGILAYLLAFEHDKDAME